MANYEPKKKRNGKLENRCIRILADRLDLDNDFWMFSGRDADGTEWENLVKVTEIIGKIMGQDSSVIVRGKPMTAGEYWSRVKNIEYDPEIMRACKRYGTHVDTGIYPWTKPVDSPLMQAIYFIAPEQESEEPRKKFAVDYVEWVEKRCPPIEIYATKPQKAKRTMRQSSTR